MNILVLCPHFRPDVAPTGEVMTRIALELAARGNRLDIVTSLPWYERHALAPGWEGQLVRSESMPWGRVTRVHPFPVDKAAVLARALAFGGFTALAGLVGMARPRPDVVLAMSPPLTLGVAGWLMARRYRVPFVFNIQDVFPDVAIELGVLRNPRVIAAARALERFVYERADSVTVLSDDLADNVLSKLRRTSAPAPDAAQRSGAAAPLRLGSAKRAPATHAEPEQKVVVIPNFVDTEAIRPAPTQNSYRAEHGLSGRTVVMYAGNVGLSQSFDLVLQAAKDLAGRPEVAFVINGGGVALADLQRRAEGLANVSFVGMQPRERLAEVLAAADIHVVPLKRGLARSSVPSKTYSILAAGRPVVASVDEGTEVARTVEAAGAGLAVPPEDPAAFTMALRQLLDDPSRARAMGEAGRAWVERWASPAAVAAAYEELFEQLAGRRRGGTVASRG